MGRAGNTLQSVREITVKNLSKNIQNIITINLLTNIINNWQRKSIVITHGLQVTGGIDGLSLQSERKGF